MKRHLTAVVKLMLVACFSMVITTYVNAQCGTGYTRAQTNWDNLDFLPSTGNRYTDYYSGAVSAYNQNFALGTNTVNFNFSSSFTLDGEQTAHTGDITANSVTYAGADVRFIPTANNSSFTITFENLVQDARFALYDIDNNASYRVTAVNGLGVAQNIDLDYTGSRLTVSGSSTSRDITANSSKTDNANNRGTVVIRVDGPVKSITITVLAMGTDAPDREVYLSDIWACVTGSFPNNYYGVSRPFTGQPQYVLTVLGNTVYQTNTANGNSRPLFTDAGHTNINSTAYDPYNRIVYYTYSLMANATADRNERALRKYDVKTGLISVVVSDVRTIGIATYEEGVISGGAAFYNGSLYLGIEGYTGTSGGGSYAAGRKSCVWKINFDASGNVVGNASQVYGALADNGTSSSNIHDWADFGIVDGMLYDFNGSSSGSYILHHDLMTGQILNTYGPISSAGASGWIPGQVSVGWDGKVYQTFAQSSASIVPYIAEYNMNGTIGTKYNMTAASPFIPAIPSLGDAAEAFRPYMDFGDAPLSYEGADPVWAPAVHDTGTSRGALKLGPDVNVEWLKRGLTTYDDDYDDGLPYGVPILSPGNPNYAFEVNVMNNTGSDATLVAWVDFNNNGVFDPSEGRTLTFPSSPTLQAQWIYWLGITIHPGLVPGTYTYLRLRLTSASNGITVNNPTGYYSNGEVEDYRVVVDNAPLPTYLLSFNAKKQSGNAVKLDWTAIGENDLQFFGYTIERSAEGTKWESIAYVPGKKTNNQTAYEFIDHSPAGGTNRYRIVIGQSNGRNKTSDIRTVEFPQTGKWLTVAPNPVVDRIKITCDNNTQRGSIDVRILSTAGVTLLKEVKKINAGKNQLEVAVPATWNNGTYFVQVTDGVNTETHKIIIKR
ncbi:GEVED domain-containing protein [Terrimonas rubra]|uniref:GEVED domain-containing protein n=1 Tax=Terrimonas rubra TaxID=1035890 RepID=A0ABW5ZYP3_9BACT